ncbi:MAG: hypothetical protein IJ038_00685 [Clostridia bacterium]|nr:hypothetical protein [Clostridia bacterium]
MARKINWNIKLDDGEHKVSLLYSMLTGKAVVTIDGDKFDISTGFLKLRGTNQVFKLGEEAAILDFPKRGEPDVYINGVGVNSGKRHGE